MQHAIVLQIVHQRAWRIDRIGLQENGGAGDPGRLAALEASSRPSSSTLSRRSFAASSERPRIQVIMVTMMAAPMSTGI